MANSKIGQYQIEYTLEGFTAPTRSHKLRMTVQAIGSPAAGTPANAIDIAKKDTTTAKLDVVANQAWSFFRLMYPSAISASSFTLWYWVTNNVRDFVSSGTLTTPTGGTAGAVQPAQQTMLTFRSGNGGIAKFAFIEPYIGGDTRQALTPNAAGTPAQRIAAYLLSGDSPAQSLSNGFLVAALRDSKGQNEAVWRLLYRSGS